MLWRYKREDESLIFTFPSYAESHPSKPTEFNGQRRCTSAAETTVSPLEITLSAQLGHTQANKTLSPKGQFWEVQAGHRHRRGKFLKGTRTGSPLRVSFLPSLSFCRSVLSWHLVSTVRGHRNGQMIKMQNHWKKIQRMQWCVKPKDEFWSKNIPQGTKMAFGIDIRMPHTPGPASDTSGLEGSTLISGLTYWPLWSCSVTFQLLHDTFQQLTDVTEVPDLPIQSYRKSHRIFKHLFFFIPEDKPLSIQSRIPTPEQRNERRSTQKA